LETHLRNKLGNLFDLEFDLLLYDVASTYFEGQCNGNPHAKHGRSRNHRGDCMQVCIGFFVTKDGIPPAAKCSPTTHAIVEMDSFPDEPFF